jgi:hypothetical protein
MNLFTNSVTLRGFLAENAQAPSSDRITDESVATLALATVSGSWDLGANQWHPRTDVHRIVCPGPYFCGLVRGMRRGDYVEVEGELRTQKEARPVVVGGERSVVERDAYTTYAVRITRLDRPDALVDFGDSDT